MKWVLTETTIVNGERSKVALNEYANRVEGKIALKRCLQGRNHLIPLALWRILRG